MAKSKLNSKAFLGVLFSLSVIGAICFRSCRPVWVFINIGSFNLSIILFAFIVLAAILTGTLFSLKVWESELCNKKAFDSLVFVATPFSAILTAFSLIYTIGYAPGEESEVFTLYLGKTLKEGALLLLVPFFTIFYPKICVKTKKIIAIILMLAVFLFGFNAFYPLTSYKITADPMVVDNGSEYSIVFATSDEGTAFVEYTYEGQTYKVFDDEGGRLTTGKVHTIAVPYEHLRNNTYKVSSTRVVEDFSYGSRLGAEVSSKEYEFRYNDTENQTWLVISDWHTHTDKADKAIENLDSEFDGVMLVGDSTPGVDFEQQFISNTIEFGGKVSNGTKPVLYVRGNHETRGSYADEIPGALGINQLYYTADVGPYSFVVLDSGEDKVDSHVEYGGMTNYNAYRADMISWLKGVDTENERVIALSHAWQISSVEPELSAEGYKELQRLGARVMLSGHEHVCEIKQNEKAPDIVTYIDGGNCSEGYVASMLTLSENGFEIKAVSDSGTEILNEQFTW